MEHESATLREEIHNREDELWELRKIREEGQQKDERSADTERVRLFSDSPLSQHSLL